MQDAAAAETGGERRYGLNGLGRAQLWLRGCYVALLAVGAVLAAGQSAAGLLAVAIGLTALVVWLSKGLPYEVVLTEEALLVKTLWAPRRMPWDSIVGAVPWVDEYAAAAIRVPDDAADGGLAMLEGLMLCIAGPGDTTQTVLVRESWLQDGREALTAIRARIPGQAPICGDAPAELRLIAFRGRRRMLQPLLVLAAMLLVMPAIVGVAIGIAHGSIAPLVAVAAGVAVAATVVCLVGAARSLWQDRQEEAGLEAQAETEGDWDTVAERAMRSVEKAQAGADADTLRLAPSPAGLRRMRVLGWAGVPMLALALVSSGAHYWLLAILPLLLTIWFWREAATARSVAIAPDALLVNTLYDARWIRWDRLTEVEHSPSGIVLNGPGRWLSSRNIPVSAALPQDGEAAVDEIRRRVAGPPVATGGFEWRFVLWLRNWEAPLAVVPALAATVGTVQTVRSAIAAGLGSEVVGTAVLLPFWVAVFLVGRADRRRVNRALERTLGKGGD